MQLDPECKSAQPCWKGCGNQYPLALKNVYNLWPSNPIHRCTSNKSAYTCVHQNICERFPVALFIHNGPNQKLPRCPSTLEQTNELGDHRTWEQMCSHGNTTTHYDAEEAHKGVHTVSQGSAGGTGRRVEGGLGSWHRRFVQFVRTHQLHQALFHIQLKGKIQRTDLQMDREAWRATVHGVRKRHDWAPEPNWKDWMESCLLPLHRPLTASLGSTAPTTTASDRRAEPKGSAFTRTLRRRQIQPRWCSKIILGTHRTKNHSEPASTLMASEVGWTMSPTRSPTPTPPSTAFLASSLTDAGTPCESPASQSPASEPSRVDAITDSPQSQVWSMWPRPTNQGQTFPDWWACDKPGQWEQALGLLLSMLGQRLPKVPPEGSLPRSWELLPRVVSAKDTTLHSPRSNSHVIGPEPRGLTACLEPWV